MTQTNGIGNANVLNTALGATDRAESVRTGVVRTAGKEATAIQNSSNRTSTTSLSGLGSILATSVPGTTDVRADKVAALKSAIDSGTYKVPASAVADKLISGLLSQG